jgi:hypothetical protein
VSFLQKLDWGVKVLGDLDACRRIALENVADAATPYCCTPARTPSITASTTPAIGS